MQFKVLADAFEHLETTSSRLKMTDILADLFKKAKSAEIKNIMYLLQSRVAPPFEPIEIGMGEKFVEDAISKATGYGRDEVTKEYKKTGDLGTVAETFINKKAQRSLVQKKLSISDVFTSFEKIANAGGKGSQDVKIKNLTNLLNNASALEARYLVRIPLGKLRLGIGDPTILDALSVKEKGDKSLREPLERAYNLCSDLGIVAEEFYKKGMKGIEKFKIHAGNPIRPALAERLPSAEEIIKKIGKCSIEAKYDGFRLQIHKKGNDIDIYSRRAENMTNMFPEVVEAVKKISAKDMILDGEALSFNEETGEFYSFQSTIQRKRKYGVEKIAKEMPLKVFVFDLLSVDGKDLTQKKYSERRKLIEKYFSKGDLLRPAEAIVSDKPKELEKFFDNCVSRGLEGVIAKDLNALYVAGARKYAWIKLKRSYKGELSDTVDVVIVGYMKGRGMRSKFGLGAVLGAVYDEDDDHFKTIAKVGSGFSEEQMIELNKMLDKIKVSKKPARLVSLIEADGWVEPKYVITLMADEITESPMHTAGRKGDTGYALRFPRLVGWIREDKKAEDATSVSEIIKMFNMQRKTKEE